MDNPDVLHIETSEAIDAFMAALRRKLIRAQQKRGVFVEWKYADWREECQSELLRHVYKGDPLDVAAYALFCYSRGWPTAAPPPLSGETSDAITKRLEQVQTANLVRAITAEIESGSPVENVYEAILGICVFALIPIVAGGKPEKRKAIVADAIQTLGGALSDFADGQSQLDTVGNA